MKKHLKKIISTVLAVTLLFSAVPLAGLVGIEFPGMKDIFTPKAEAATTTRNGTIGQLTYTIISYDETGEAELIINGTGDMINFDIAANIIPPWDGIKDSIKSVTIGYSVTSIGDHAFSDCKNLTTITIPDSVTSIGEGAFQNCEILTSVSIGNGVTNIGGFAFSYCPKLTSVIIPNGLTSIGDSAFDQCSNLASITIPDSVMSIGEAAFSGCSSLTSVTIPDGVTSIEAFTFSYCTNLKSVTISNNATNIGHMAFSNCLSLTSITIPDSVTSIDSYAFQSCENLATIIIPDNVTSIGGSAFASTAYYKNGSNWEDGLLYLGDYLIASDRLSLSSECTIKKGTKIIANSVFFSCNGLESIIIPDSVTSIGDGAFSECYGITAVYYGGSKSQWDKIIIGSDNYKLEHATIHYAKEDVTDPTTKPVEEPTTKPTEPTTNPTHTTIPADDVEFKKPSQATINYGDKIILHVDVDLPEGARVVWEPSNDNFSYEVSADSKTCIITPESSGETVFTIKIVDKDNNVISKEYKQTVNAKAGIFQKIIAFFKGLFGLNKTIPQTIKFIF